MQRILGVLFVVVAMVATLTGVDPAVARAAPPRTAATGVPTEPDYTPLSPARLLDSRDGQGVARGPVRAASTTSVQVLGRGGVPSAGVSAVVLNVTVAEPTRSGFATLWPAAAPRPTTSNVNFVTHETVANQVIVKVGAGGIVDLFSSAGTQLFVDVSGYYPTGAAYDPLQPSRLLDTRHASSHPSGDSTTQVTVTGRGGVPATGVGAVVLNVTAIPRASAGWLTLFPAGVTRPPTSVVDYVPGQTTAGMGIVKVGATGAVDIYSASAVDLLVDVVGWIPTTSDYTAITPVRVADTRDGTGGTSGKVSAATALDVPIAGLRGVPITGVRAVEVSVTVTRAAHAGWATVFAGGAPSPGTSTLNFGSAATVANSATVALGANGHLEVGVSTAADVIVDLVGYVTTGPVPVPPLSVTTSSMPSGFVGTPYNATLTASGGKPPYTWAVSGLPAGLLLDSRSGTVSGTPTASAFATITASVTDQVGHSIGRTLPIAVPDSHSVTSLVRTNAGMCGILTGGDVQCWGDNTYGQLGDGGTEATGSRPVQVVGLTSGVTELANTADGSCAVRTDGTVWCWGNNWLGQLGDGGSERESNRPVQVTGLTSAVAHLVPETTGMCAVLSGGGVMCWGDNGGGELGNGVVGGYSSVPVPVEGLSSGVVQLAGGFRSMCAVVSGGARCWGHNREGELGDGTAVDESGVPTHVVGMSSGVVQVISARAGFCAILAAGDLKCWGDDSDGQLGNAHTGGHSNVPVQVAGLTSGVTSVYDGFDGTCAVRAGSALCWGDNTFGQLGDGRSGGLSNVPVQVVGLTSGVTQMTATTAAICAVRAGRALCWGDNTYKALGDGGTEVQASSPRQVSGLTSGVTALEPGFEAFCALRNRGVSCWGDRTLGELGDGTEGGQAAVPVQVGGLTG
ncbi:putative Ig domain-containing protein [Allobranchiibius sp. CTAmp26]|uniref:putative Ig domain-containing protein n=1 Tax=Allobranchiibius sp. CTAmp26 TaxID=2815214 RepID=UPI001AA0D8B5|nr:putative Ig domain-containing protein [Allobranchiibius sp. CTAmp26]MBO1756768.1 putative Ig domain-containing protein [Allobranchiibius sp. CTAmp26]